jgi:YegS/Rv2252/BmrU family lipid kinase
MTHAFGPLRVILNPASGQGHLRQRLHALRAELDQRGVDHEVVPTQGPGHATELAREALGQGWRYIAAAGGDGTVNEVVNGWFDGDKPINDEAVLGVVSSGSGCDFVRTFGLPGRFDLLAGHLASEDVAPVDVGKIGYHDRDDGETTRLFANVANVGWGGEVVRRANRTPRWLGRVRYLVAAYGAIAAAHRPQARVALAHTSWERPLVNLVVANGQFFGGGMKVAPRAVPDDDRFNVQLFWGRRSQVFVLTTRIYRGEHIPHPNIAEHQSPTAVVDAPEALPIEADGEDLGVTPARFSLLHQALRLKL